MSENQIKVNSIEELISQAEEFATSQGGTTKTKIGSSVVNSGEYVYREGKMVQEIKGNVSIELEGEDNSSVKLFLEDQEERSVGDLTCNHDLYQQVIQELNKIGISHRSPFPKKKNENLTNLGDENENPSDKSRKSGFSVISIPCSTLDEMKEHIKKYYQKNHAEINKNPDFNQWVETIYSHFGEKTNCSEKDGKEISEVYASEWTISLKEYEEKGMNIQTNLCLKKVERDENYFNLAPFEDEKELENYWNSLVENQETKNPTKSFVNSSSETKIKSEQIKKLRQEIKELESNSQTNNNSEKQKQLAKKRKELNELERNLDNISTSNKFNGNLALYLSLGGIIITLVGGIMVRWFYLRKKNKK